MILQPAPILITPPREAIPPGVKGDPLLTNIIANSVTILFTIGAILLILMVLWGGIDWISSAGDKEKASNARKKITSALIGLAVMGLTYLIVRVLGTIVGFNVFNGALIFPNLGGP